MRTRVQRICSFAALVAMVVMAAAVFTVNSRFENVTLAQTNATPTPTPAVAGTFDQAAAIAKLKEQIKGHEQEPASQVFKNIHTLTNTPAGRLLAIMEIGYSRSLGVNCAHCHTPDKWESEEKPQKQIARDMSMMLTTINKDLLKNIKNLKSATPGINCTTCHRGQIVPAMNLPQPPKS